MEWKANEWLLTIYIAGRPPIELKVARCSDDDERFCLICPTLSTNRELLVASSVEEAKVEALQYLHQIVNAMSDAVGNAIAELNAAAVVGAE